MSAPNDDFQDSSYTDSRDANKNTIPVDSDSAAVESGVAADGSEDSDETLQRDDAEAIDQNNVIEERTRGAAKEEGSYAEPGDEEGLPEDDGRSRVAQ